MPIRRSIVRDSLGVGVATGAYGVSFGAIAVGAGFSVLQACALSSLVFTGGSQFALVGVVAAGGAPLSGAATGILLGSRNALYGLRLASLLRVRGARRALTAQLVIDESTAMAVAQESAPEGRLAFYATGLSVFALWNVATLVGGPAGDALGDPRRYGLDAAVAAAFLALLWPRLSSVAARVCALGAVAVALGLTPFAPGGVPVLVAGLVAVVAGARR